MRGRARLVSRNKKKLLGKSTLFKEKGKVQREEKDKRAVLYKEQNKTMKETLSSRNMKSCTVLFVE